MDDPGLMRGVNGSGQCDHQLRGSLSRLGRPRESFRQASPVEQFQRQEGTIVNGTDVVDLKDVGMAKLSNRLGLDAEAEELIGALLEPPRIIFTATRRFRRIWRPCRPLPCRLRPVFPGGHSPGSGVPGEGRPRHDCDRVDAGDRPFRWWYRDLSSSDRGTRIPLLEVFRDDGLEDRLQSGRGGGTGIRGGLGSPTALPSARRAHWSGRWSSGSRNPGLSASVPWSCRPGASRDLRAVPSSIPRSAAVDDRAFPEPGSRSGPTAHIAPRDAGGDPSKIQSVVEMSPDQSVEHSRKATSMSSATSGNRDR